MTFFMPAMPAMGMAAMTTKAKLSGQGNGAVPGNWQFFSLAERGR